MPGKYSGYAKNTGLSQGFQREREQHRQRVPIGAHESLRKSREDDRLREGKERCEGLNGERDELSRRVWLGRGSERPCWEMGRGHSSEFGD